MEQKNSKHEYEKRIHKVLSYIDSKIDTKIDITALAEVARFSPYHFHRLFSALTGETVGNYLRRRRVERAALKLISQPNVKILDLALSVGFGSAEAFARAFKAQFESSPTQWLKNNNTEARREAIHKINSKMSQVLPFLNCDHEFNKQSLLNSITIIERKPVEIAYFRHRGPYIGGIAKFWQEVYRPWAIANQLGPHHARYGIAHDDPNITDEAVCIYDACAEIAAERPLKGEALRGTIPGGKYAVAIFNDSMANIAHAWTAILGNWLPPSGWQLDNRPSFEYTPSGAGIDPNTGKAKCELCIPVTKL